MKAYNKRLDHKTLVASIDYTDKKVQLVQPGSNPLFIYTEKLSNIKVLEDTGVKLDGVSVYVNDTIYDGKRKLIVRKVPGGFYPFINPVKKNFKLTKGTI